MVRSGTILLVGGYGHVGTLLARELAIRYPGQLVVAGRNAEKAQALAATLPGSVRSTVIDVRSEESVKLAVQHTALLVNCSVDQLQPSLLRAALASGCS
jgi:saccharopine dehydrogenase-like NADP-dependent oxidoreductase